jgi:hypothetical protein
MERVEWINEESREIVGYGVFKKGDRFDAPSKLAKQLISQGLVKDAYKEKKSKTKKDK